MTHGLLRGVGFAQIPVRLIPLLLHRLALPCEGSSALIELSMGLMEAAQLVVKIARGGLRLPQIPLGLFPLLRGGCRGLLPARGLRLRLGKLPGQLVDVGVQLGSLGALLTQEPAGFVALLPDRIQLPRVLAQGLLSIFQLFVELLNLLGVVLAHRPLA